jgi:hypothetical protein
MPGGVTAESATGTQVLERLKQHPPPVFRPDEATCLARPLLARPRHASPPRTFVVRPALAGYAQPDGPSPAPPGRGRRVLRDGPRFRRGSSSVLAKSASSSDSFAYSPRTSDCPSVSSCVPSRPPQSGHRPGLSCPEKDCRALGEPCGRSLVMKRSPVRVRASALPISRAFRARAHLLGVNACRLSRCR